MKVFKIKVMFDNTVQEVGVIAENEQQAKSYINSISDIIILGG